MNVCYVTVRELKRLHSALEFRYRWPFSNGNSELSELCTNRG